MGFLSFLKSLLCPKPKDKEIFDKIREELKGKEK